MLIDWERNTWTYEFTRAFHTDLFRKNIQLGCLRNKLIRRFYRWISIMRRCREHKKHAICRDYDLMRCMHTWKHAFCRQKSLEASLIFNYRGMNYRIPLVIQQRRLVPLSLGFPTQHMKRRPKVKFVRQTCLFPPGNLRLLSVKYLSCHFLIANITCSRFPGPSEDVRITW